jgi:hypothetical protein
MKGMRFSEKQIAYALGRRDPVLLANQTGRSPLKPQRPVVDKADVLARRLLEDERLPRPDHRERHFVVEDRRKECSMTLSSKSPENHTGAFILRFVRIDVPMSGPAPSGSVTPDMDTYFCRWCQSFVFAPKGSPGLRACPTPGCRRPNGFGPVFSRQPKRTTGGYRGNTPLAPGSVLGQGSRHNKQDSCSRPDGRSA